MRQEIIDKLELLEEYIAVLKDLQQYRGENGILPEAFARKIEPAAGFRNILVHMYAKVEVGRLYENLQNGVEDMKVFIEYIARFLAEEKRLNLF